MKTFAGCCVFLVCLCTGLLAQQSPTPSGHPLTVLNGSGDGRYAAGEIVPIAGDGAADGFTFLGWIVLTLNGRVTSWNEQSQFVMPNHASTVAAVYGKVETWFPPGDEQVKTGLLLPKSSEDPQHRSQQKVRVTFSLGDAAGRLKPRDLWSISRVLIDWFPKPEAEGKWGASEVIRCLDKEAKGEEIGRNQAIPKEAFDEVTQGVFEASVWHEGIWSLEQSAGKGGEDEEMVHPALDVRIDLGVSSYPSFFISRMKASCSLLPLMIQVKKKSTSKQPKNGLVVKQGDVIEICLDQIPEDNALLTSENTSWFSRKLKIDGTYTPWEELGEHARGVRFDQTCENSGIFQLKCRFEIGTRAMTVIFERRRDELKTANGYMGPGRKGAPDAFGVSDLQRHIDIRNNALRYLGSPTYAHYTHVPALYGFPEFSAGPDAEVVQQSVCKSGSA